MDNRQVIQKYNPTDNLEISVSVTYDESKIFLDVDYLKGKFTLQRTFKNNFIGLEELESDKEHFNTEELVKEYFGLQGE